MEQLTTCCKDESILIFCLFALFLTNCSGPYHGLFSMILGSFVCQHTPGKHCLQNGQLIVEMCLILFWYFCAFAHQLLRTLPCLLLHNMRLVWVPTHSPKTFHKTVYKMVDSLWKYVSFYFCPFTLLLTSYSGTYSGMFPFS